jgi:hypothetical protein
MIEYIYSLYSSVGGTYEEREREMKVEILLELYDIKKKETE